MKRYDVVIIGSGLGGLACGAMLSREGMSVCVLEQHSRIGGCFQSFRRGGYVLDTGIHYVGSLGEGQIMRQYFRYFGILDRLRLRKLDEAAFDVIDFGDGQAYGHAMGYDRFVETLARDFPHERRGLEAYCRLLRSVGELISPEILRQGRISAGGMEYMGVPICDEIARLIRDPKLRNVLAGSITLYAGDRVRSSVYEHAMINHSNIEGAYSFVGGTGQVPDALAEVIRGHGGEVRASSKVARIVLENGAVDCVELRDGERLFARNVVSAIHPALTFSMLENNTVIRKAFFTRVQSLENSYGLFTTYLLMKPRTVRCVHRNYYLYNTPDVWATEADYRGCNIPSVLLCMQGGPSGEWAEVVTLLTPVPGDPLARWWDTETGHRGPEYEAYKQRFAEAVIDFAERFFPGLKAGIGAVFTASPLTYRDYTSTPGGSAYGIVKDCRNPIVSHLPARTKIPNLYLTGQNLNVHGCLGVAVSAAVTCSELLGTEYLAKKIGECV